MSEAGRLALLRFDERFMWVGIILAMLFVTMLVSLYMTGMVLNWRNATNIIQSAIKPPHNGSQIMW